MNKSARLIFSVAPRVPTTRFSIKLHWLPIKARIELKICLIVFKALRFGQPKYIADMLSDCICIFLFRSMHEWKWLFLFSIYVFKCFIKSFISNFC